MENEDKKITLTKADEIETEIEKELENGDANCEEPEKTSTTKRVLAWIGIGLLLAMYLTNLVLALIGSDFARTMLLCCSVCTVMIPIILYFLLLMIKKRKPKK